MNRLFALTALVVAPVALGQDDVDRPFYGPGDRAAVAPDATAPPVAPVASRREVAPNRLYLGLRVGGGLPLGAAGFAGGGSMSVGGELAGHHLLGLRLGALALPTFPSGAPDVVATTGIEYGYRIPVLADADLIPGVTVGLAVGPERGRNAVYGTVDASLAARFRFGDGGRQHFLQPEVGYAIGSTTPFAALGYGVRF
jgi:hypothetical protein